MSVACSTSTSGPVDVGVADSGSTDAGASDLGTNDLGTADTGATDLGTGNVDTGVVCSSGPECDDQNPCTDDTCGATGSCSYANNAAVCNDGDSCTTVDRCEAGACVGRAQGCSATSECVEDLIPILPELAGGCVINAPAIFTTYGIPASCNITNGCGTRNGCPLSVGMGPVTTTYLAPSASFNRGAVRLAFTANAFSTTFLFNSECRFTASLASGATAYGEYTFYLRDALVCGQPLDFVPSATFVVTGNVDVVGVPLGSTSQATCDAYALQVSQTARRQIVSQVVYEYMGAITRICGACDDASCEAGVRCEP